MPSSLLAVDRAQTPLRTTWSRKPLYITPFGYSARQNFQVHGNGFNGEVIDPATGHYPLGNGHRTYDPALARFNSPDRLSPFGPGFLNSYAYCQGDPVNWRDPSGEARVPVETRFLTLRAPVSLILLQVYWILARRELPHPPAPPEPFTQPKLDSSMERLEGARAVSSAQSPSIVPVRRRDLPRHVLMAATEYVRADEERTEPEGSLAARQLRVRQG